MSRIEFAPEVTDDFDRILDHLRQHDVDDTASRIREIIHAVDVLEHNPHIGRPTNRPMRELIIGRDSHGYVALYQYIAEVDIVLVLAIRSQREAGYARP
jgi:toxin ParE1/3/4